MTNTINHVTSPEKGSQHEFSFRTFALERRGWWLIPNQAGAWSNRHVPHDSWELLERSARYLGARQVWIYPDAIPPGPPPGRVMAPGGRPVWSWVPGQWTLELSFVAERASQSVWAGLSPPELLTELGRLEGAIRHRWVASGGITSDVWLRTYHRQPGTVPIRAGAVLDLTPSRRTRGPRVIADSIHWVGEGPRAGRYCHAYDINGMYLGAASAIGWPEGQARHLDRVEAGDATRAGYHLIDRLGPEVIGLPAEPCWVPTPTLAYASKRRQVAVRESWVWDRQHRHLDAWYRTMRDARSELGTGPALDALKEIYRAGIGRIGSSARARSDDPLYQPYVRHAVISEGNARMLARLEKMPTPAAAIDVDCAWFFTDERDPGIFAAAQGLRLDDQLGHWHYQGSIAGDDARALLLERPTKALIELRGALRDGED